MCWHTHLLKVPSSHPETTTSSLLEQAHTSQTASVGPYAPRDVALATAMNGLSEAALSTAQQSPAEAQAPVSRTVDHTAESLAALDPLLDFRSKEILQRRFCTQ